MFSTAFVGRVDDVVVRQMWQASSLMTLAISRSAKAATLAWQGSGGRDLVAGDCLSGRLANGSFVTSATALAPISCMLGGCLGAFIRCYPILHSGTLGLEIRTYSDQWRWLGWVYHRASESATANQMCLTPEPHNTAATVFLSYGSCFTGGYLT